METSKYRPVEFLLGSQSTYSTGNVVGSPVNRNAYRSHIVQRIVKDADVGDNPVVLVQFCLNTVDEIADAQEWTTFATLDNTTKFVSISDVFFSAVRAVRSDSTTSNVKVLIGSSNYPTD